MEPVTHFLTGACLGRAGLNRATGLATLTLTLAAEAPDIDVIASWWGPVTGFAHHRGFSHTLLGAPVMSALVTGVVWCVYKLWSRRGRNTRVPIRWWVVYLLALFASLSHILLDFTNNYGVRPFAPFNPRWYSWDIIFIVEPVLLTALFLGLIIPSILGLVGGEIGAKKPLFRGQVSALVALGVMAAFWIMRDGQHRKALEMLNSRIYDTGAALRVGAMPYAINPYRWYGVVETPNAYETFDIDSRGPTLTARGRDGTYFKPMETAPDLAAKKSYLGRVYLDWARFPITETTTDHDGFIVYFRDVRYLYSVLPSESEEQVKSALGARVVLDKQLNVEEMWMGRKKQEP
jgi:inner membrane protein